MSSIEQQEGKTIFQEILDRKKPGVVLATSDHCFSILTIQQSTEFHSLIIPKKRVAKLAELSDQEYYDICAMTEYIKGGILAILPDHSKVGELVSGFEIKNHFHRYLIPAKAGRDVSIQNTQEVDISTRLLQGESIQESLEKIGRSYRGVSFNLPDNNGSQINK